jgi:hypothetical protein
MKIIIFFNLLLTIIYSQRYLGGNGNYSENNPGSDLADCLADESGMCIVINNHTCNGNVDVNVINAYTIKGVDSVSKIILSLIGDSWIFYISKEYIFENLNVCIIEF